MSRVRRGAGCRARRGGAGAAAAVLALVAAGCGAGSGSGDLRPAASGDLQGWTYAAVAGKGDAFAEHVKASLAFGDGDTTQGAGALGVYDGCSQIGYSSYAVVAGKLAVGEERVQATAPCSADRQAQDGRLRAFLRAQPTAQIRDGGTGLVLTSGPESVTFGLRRHAKARPAGVDPCACRPPATQAQPAQP